MATAFANNFEYARGYVSVGERSDIANKIRDLHKTVVEANSELTEKDLELRKTLNTLTLTEKDKKKLEDALKVSETKTAEATAKIDSATHDLDVAFDAILKLIIIDQEAKDKVKDIETKKAMEASAVFSNMFNNLKIGFESPQAVRLQNLVEAGIPGNTNLIAHAKADDDENSA